MTQRGEIIAGYLLGETLGVGTYGKVKLGRGHSSFSPTSERAEFVAVKILDRHRFDAVAVKKEIAVHKRCNYHPNVVKYVDFMVKPNLSFILLELAEGGELYHRIVPDVGVAPDVAHFFFIQLIAAVGYFQSRGVAHRDIKPENILLDKFGNVKVTDFGLATVYRFKETTRALTKKCGTPPYVAPEVYAGQEYDGGLVDLWSCGVVLVALTAGWLPWRVPSPKDIDYNLWAHNKHNECAWVERSRRIHQAYPVLLGMLQPDVRKRWDVEKVKESEWFKQKTDLTAMIREDGLIHVETDLLKVDEEPKLELSQSVTATQRAYSNSEKRRRNDSSYDEASGGAEPWSPPPGGAAAAPAATPKIKRDSCFTSRLNFRDTVEKLEDTLELLFQPKESNYATDLKAGDKRSIDDKAESAVGPTIQKNGMATITVTTTNPEGEPLIFTVRVRPKGGCKQLVDFMMHAESDAMEFKRKYMQVCEVLFPLESFNACTETQYQTQYSANIV
eukprot:m.205460 g.205460  ORF g.205460 m.205460 type:complete len:502 (+) comp22945_c0_seq1:92-1597(+)